MTRSLGYLSVLVAACATVGSVAVATTGLVTGLSVGGIDLEPIAVRGLRMLAIVAALAGAYVLLLEALARRASKRRIHNARNVLRLVFGALSVIAVFGVATEQ